MSVTYRKAARGFWCWLLHRAAPCFLLDERRDARHCKKCRTIFA